MTRSRTGASAVSTNQRVHPAILPLALCALGAGVVLLLASSWPMFARTWIRRDYSHGPLIPLISLYFLWRDRKRLQTLQPTPHLLAGLPLLGLGVISLLLGRAGSVVVVELSSVPVVLAGLVLTILGPAFLRAAAIPIGYLFFMVPLPDLLLPKIHWPLQLFAAKTCGAILSALGIPNLQKDQFIMLPEVVLEIAGECSGISFIISILAVAIPLAYFTQTSLTRRLLVVAGAAVIGLAANLARITLVGAWAYHNPGVGVHGPHHIFQGVFVSVIGYAFLFLYALYAVPLTCRRRNKCSTNEHQSREREEQPRAPADRDRLVPAVAACTVLLFAAAGYYNLHGVQPIPLRAALTLPSQVGQWRGTDVPASSARFRVPGASGETQSEYRSREGLSVTVYVAYLDAQRQGQELIFYTHDALYQDSRSVRLDTDAGPRNVNSAVVPNFQGGSAFLYWHDLRARTVGNRFLLKFLTAVGRLVNNRTNGAFVLISMPYVRDEQIPSTINVLRDFAREILPVVNSSLARATGDP